MPRKTSEIIDADKANFKEILRRSQDELVAMKTEKRLENGKYMEARKKKKKSVKSKRKKKNCGCDK
jgi:hypothetical protein